MNRYRYNGKELNQELGLYEYGARWYDPVIGRFTGVDPISDKFAHLSTYNYASNEPVANIDLHGLQGIRYDMAAFDPGLDAIKATSTERQAYQQAMGVGFGLGVLTTVAVMGAAELVPASAFSLEASGVTIATNVATDAAVQTVVNSATGKDVVGDFDLVGTATSALTNPVIASAIDGVIDVTLNDGVDVNTPEEAMINTAVGG